MTTPEVISANDDNMVEWAFKHAQHIGQAAIEWFGNHPSYHVVGLDQPLDGRIARSRNDLTPEFVKRVV